MEQYEYSVSYYRIKNKELLVTDNLGDITFELKQNRFFLREIKKVLFELTKNTYSVYDAVTKKRLYLIHSTSRGFYLNIGESNLKIKVKSKSVQLLEKMYLFNLGKVPYTFEIDAKRVGILSRDKEIVATATILNLLQQNKDNHIQIKALNSDLAALCLVCYQTFHMAAYEGKYIS